MKVLLEQVASQEHLPKNRCFWEGQGQRTFEKLLKDSGCQSGLSSLLQKESSMQSFDEWAEVKLGMKRQVGSSQSAEIGKGEADEAGELTEDEGGDIDSEESLEGVALTAKPMLARSASGSLVMKEKSKTVVETPAGKKTKKDASMAASVESKPASTTSGDGNWKDDPEKPVPPGGTPGHEHVGT